MREIKFRAWDRQFKKMRDMDWLLEGPLHHILSCGLKRFELMQFTGLYDRNNTPIYEGDIVSFMQDLSNPQEVYYSTGYFYPLATFNTSTAITVLGNIYENTLLKSITTKEK